MNKRFLNILLISTILGIVAFSSCDGSKNSPKTQKPDNLISKEKITDIMLDVYIVESVIYLKSQRGIDIGLYATVYYNSTFKKHNVTRKQFTSSLAYYLETDNNASSLFLDVINRLVAMQKPGVSSSTTQQAEQKSEANEQTTPNNNEMPNNPLIKNQN